MAALFVRLRRARRTKPCIVPRGLSQIYLRAWPLLLHALKCCDGADGRAGAGTRVAMRIAACVGRPGSSAVTPAPRWLAVSSPPLCHSATLGKNAAPAASVGLCAASAPRVSTPGDGSRRRCLGKLATAARCISAEVVPSPPLSA
eukprot:CAMPEP_0179155114 /NCGR_PEP_ID=MMETSP0796-20121207/75539_1 /TAXON_ID=73915 /ORGANISM="Pyrodinium bahamense, Strain pbaha01" /LENGTH=144 /DNA_ID=CAMNT_0020856567 /DNA_START=146 /DNA_END=577 /DNA_ORIENTATION=-